jgi:hypothetical protein
VAMLEPPNLCARQTRADGEAALGGGDGAGRDGRSDMGDR